MQNLTLSYENGTPLRYGENSHQNAMFYKDPNCTEASLATAEQLHGKELSYNNIVDADAALEMVREFSDSNAVAIIKHLNPCGLATGKTLAEAFNAAWEGDPVSAFGSVIAVSRKVDLQTAELLKGRFVEILLAPDFEADALEFLRNKSKDIRLLKVGKIEPPKVCKVYKHVIGGMLVQDRDVECWEKFECVTKAEFPEKKQALAKFSWLVCKHTKSNAIVMCHEYKPSQFMILGLGPGQPNRIDSNLRLCQPRVADNIKRMNLPESTWGELVMASDAFFPFADNIDASNSAGIRYIVQPGGSKKDNEVIEACDKFGIAMAFTATRHFRH
jgi:phosphoribosylaminoimidazolecarboxamide formyltransferase/IMP cyclohydrolase